MESLLKNELTAYYQLPNTIPPVITATTAADYFELKDDNIIIYNTVGAGIAKYNNRSLLKVKVINYECFFNSLSTGFIQHKEKCDLIIYDDKEQHFILNELTDTLPKYILPYTNVKGHQLGKKQKAISQLLSTLNIIMNVPAIKSFVNKHNFKDCCFFSKQSMAPSIITATTAFNRVNTVASNGLQMPNPTIEAHGFRFWEYYDNQVYNLQ